MDVSSQTARDAAMTSAIGKHNSGDVVAATKDRSEIPSTTLTARHRYHV
jgi:hypothetical protein